MFQRKLSNGWTLTAWMEHARELDVERQRALQIKETGDSRALILAADNQRLRDEQHNDLLNQWRADRSTFVTKDELSATIDKLQASSHADFLRFEAMIQPLSDYSSSQKGRSSGTSSLVALLLSVGVILVGLGSWISPHIH